MSQRRGARVWRFLSKRWPPVPNVAGAFVLAAALSLAAQAALPERSAGALVLGLRELFAALLAVATSLLMRAYDELKDVETDLRLAAAGDARFQDRPIVTGEVQRGDLVLVKGVALALFAAATVGAAVVAARPAAVVAAAGVLFGVVWLSSRWFFWPRIQRDLLLAFATHNPVAGLVGLAMLAVVVGERAPPVSVFAALVGAAWFPISVWETARKLRAPAEETDYETYSRRLGVVGAAALPALFGVLSFACVLVIAQAAQAPQIYLGVAAAGTLLLLGGAARYALRPTPASAKLLPVAELFGLLVTLGLPIAIGVAHGVRVVGP